VLFYVLGPFGRHQILKERPPNVRRPAENQSRDSIGITMDSPISMISESGRPTRMKSLN